MANGFDLDTGIADSIHHSINGINLPYHNEIDMYDRVGVLWVPPVTDVTPLSCATVNVLEATHKGVRKRSLMEIVETSSFVCVRHFHPHDPESLPDHEAKLTQLVEPMLNMPYTTGKITKGAMKPMFDWVLEQIKDYDLTAKEIDTMSELATKTEQEWGMGGKGIRFKGLLQLLMDMSYTKELPNSFSLTEIHRLVGKYNDRHNDVLKTADVMQAWTDSFNRAVIARKSPRSIFTGAFVSYVFQHLGIFEQGKFFRVMDFTSLLTSNVLGFKFLVIGPAEAALVQMPPVGDLDVETVATSAIVRAHADEAEKQKIFREKELRLLKKQEQSREQAVEDSCRASLLQQRPGWETFGAIEEGKDQESRKPKLRFNFDT